MKRVIILIILVLIPIQASAYYTGFESHGMDKVKADRILSQIPANMTRGLGSIIFTNDYCATYDPCTGAIFQFRGKWTRIVMADWDDLPDETALRYLYHELRHLHQYRQGLLTESLWLEQSDSLEEDARSFSESIFST